MNIDENSGVLLLRVRSIGVIRSLLYHSFCGGSKDYEVAMVVEYGSD